MWKQIIVMLITCVILNILYINLLGIGSENNQSKLTKSSQSTGEINENDQIVEQMNDRISAALWSISIADALAMPIHWFYNPNDITQKFGIIKDYQPAGESHPSSIMALSNTGGEGRGDQQGSIIGDVILHDKKKYWGVNGKNVHYHRGMLAGDNTLNTLCSRLVLRGITDRKGYTDQGFLKDYIAFMTTPGTHDDTYAESFHREFFKNYSNGIKPEKCAGEEGHNTASIGAFVMMPVVALLYHSKREVGIKLALQQMALTHKSESLNKYATSYLNLMFDIIEQKPNPEEFRDLVYKGASADLELDIKTLVESGKPDRQIVGRVFSTACYINDSYPAILYFAAKYAGKYEEAIIANVDVGGECCHRGSALGVLMGLANGMDAIPTRWIDGLIAKYQIRKEILDALQVMATMNLKTEL